MENIRKKIDFIVNCIVIDYSVELAIAIYNQHKNSFDKHILFEYFTTQLVKREEFNAEFYIDDFLVLEITELIFVRRTFSCNSYIKNTKLRQSIAQTQHLLTDFLSQHTFDFRNTSLSFNKKSSTLKFHKKK